MNEKLEKIQDSHLDIRASTKAGKQHLLTGLQGMGFKQVLEETWKNPDNRSRVEKLLIKLNILARDPDRKFTPEDRDALREARKRTESHMQQLEEEKSSLELFATPGTPDPTEIKRIEDQLSEANAVMGFIDVVEANLFPEELKAESVEDEYNALIERGHQLAQRITDEVIRLNGLVTAAASTPAVVPNISFAPLEALLKDSSDIEEEMKTSGNEETPAESKVIQKFISARESARKVREDYERERNRIIEEKVDTYYSAIIGDIVRFEADLASVTVSTDVPSRDPERVRLMGAIGARSTANTDADIDVEVKKRETALKKRVEDAYSNRKTRLETDEKTAEEVRRKGSLQSKIDAVMAVTLLNDADFRAISYKRVKDLHDDLTTGGTASGLDLKTVPGYQQALDRITGYLEKRRNPEYLTNEEFYDIVEDINMNLWDHQLYTQSSTTEKVQYEKTLYAHFHLKIKIGPEGESVPDRRDRLHFKTKLQLSRMNNIGKYENDRASNSRAQLFGLIQKCDVSRPEMIEATTANFKYGAEVKELLEFMISNVADRRSPIKYEVTMSTTDGRTVLERYVRSKFDTAGKLKRVDAAGVRKFSDKEVEDIFNFAFKLYYVYVLVDPAFAEYQKQTATKQHNTNDHDLDKVKDDTDRTLVYRPDSAAIHRAARYSDWSDWSLWNLVYMPPVARSWYGEGDPRNIGSNRSKNLKLAEVQTKLQLFLRAHFDASAFVGAHHAHKSSDGKMHHEFTGTLKWTEIFNPAFPDTFQFLLPAKACAGFGITIDKRYRMPEFIVNGDQIWTHEGMIGVKGQKGVEFTVYDLQTGTHVKKKIDLIGKNFDKSSMQEADTYKDTEWAWKKLEELNIMSMPSPVTDHEILLDCHDKDVPGKGLINLWISVAGRAKIFPGRHLDDYMVPYLTQYIDRIFAAFQGTDSYREVVYQKVVEKLRAAYGGEDEEKGGGLESFRVQLEQVIDNISRPNRPGTKSGLSLREYWLGNRDQRYDYTRFLYDEDKMHASRESVSRVQSMILADPKEEQFWKSVNLDRNGPGILDPEVNRKGSFESPKEGSGGGH